LRHAKSCWDDPKLSDRKRGLNKRGKRDAARMGEALSRRMAPMPVVVSPARRAQRTLVGLCDSWPALAEFDHVTDENLYTFSADDLFAWLSGQDDESRSESMRARFEHTGGPSLGSIHVKRPCSGGTLLPRKSLS
jgi:phosphohistidine phosphatase